ncbi:hypothetical protein ATANTOWER_010011 [Ataeniobius toweri]|uniref:Uncharacterized protein n=1 Tax=Ataeniobius toweri TaxID=208326 RepID=A0ABU7AZB9_9TELE|nr:hypothetical protein [Ataeniobius toweri]
MSGLRRVLSCVCQNVRPKWMAPTTMKGTLAAAVKRRFCDCEKNPLYCIATEPRSKGQVLLFLKHHCFRSQEYGDHGAAEDRGETREE